MIFFIKAVTGGLGCQIKNNQSSPSVNQRIVAAVRGDCFQHLSWKFEAAVFLFSFEFVLRLCDIIKSLFIVHWIYSCISKTMPGRLFQLVVISTSALWSVLLDYLGHKEKEVEQRGSIILEVLITVLAFKNYFKVSFGGRHVLRSTLFHAVHCMYVPVYFCAYDFCMTTLCLIQSYSGAQIRPLLLQIWVLIKDPAGCSCASDVRHFVYSW